MRVDWSLSPVAADDSPRQIMIHKAEQGMIDLVKEQMHPELADLEAAIRERLGL